MKIQANSEAEIGRGVLSDPLCKGHRNTARFTEGHTSTKSHQPGILVKLFNVRVVGRGTALHLRQQ